MLMPGDRRAESNPLSLIHRRLSQEEMSRRGRAAAASLSAPSCFGTSALNKTGTDADRDSFWVQNQRIKEIL